MHTVTVYLKERSYQIIIGKNTIQSLGRYCANLSLKGATAYVITNARIRKNYGKRITESLTKAGFPVTIQLIPDTEKSKSFAMASRLLTDISIYGRDKKIFLIALGGGVVGDLTGFIASIYKRGIPYIQIPTTLLAQVDSSIGGKTAIDLKEGKNLVGTFYQPRLVVTDMTVLQSLPKSQIKSGLAEIIKYAFIADKELFSLLERHLEDIFSFKTTFLEHVISRCCAIKARIVSHDEKEEKGIRTILNFGHTIAHAIENACGYTRYSHGQAVALGMLVAGEMSKMLNMLHPETFLRLEGLIQSAGLPTRIKHLTHSRILQAHYYDKKFIGKKNRFVLVKDIGRTEVISGIPLSVISSAVKKRT